MQCRHDAARLVLVLLAGCCACAGQQPPMQKPAAQQFVPSDQLNAALPKWISFSGEYRARIEGFTGGNYRPDNEDAYFLNRFRLNMKLQPAPWMKFGFQAQDARVWGKNQSPPVPPFQDTLDLRMAYIELGDVEKSRFSVRAGRQELVFGEQRLIGHVSWLNAARSFDAVRATLRYGNVRLDAFASSVVDTKDGTLNHHTQGNNFHGLYGSIAKLIPNAVVEPYALWRLSPRVNPELGRTGKLDFMTYGTRIAGKVYTNFDYGVEMALQRGNASTDDISAWAGHWQAGYTTPKLKYKPRWLAEYNYASGDNDPRDGRRGTFDVLYPTPHDKYGLADQVGWKNIHHLRLGPELKLTPKLGSSVNYHSWWLASARDGLYAAGGALVTRVASGTAGRHVGQELDAQLMWTVNKQVQMSGGFAHIFPGVFLQKATPGRSYNYPYVMLGYSF